MSHETPETIGRWIEETFPGGDPDSPRKAIRLLEEVVELCLACGASARGVAHAVDRSLVASGASQSLLGGWTEQPSDRQPDKIPAEAADCYIVLCGLARLIGFDLDDAVSAKMKINRLRRWKALGDGTGYHVPDAPTEASEA